MDVEQAWTLEVVLIVGMNPLQKPITQVLKAHWSLEVQDA